MLLTIYSSPTVSCLCLLEYDSSRFMGSCRDVVTLTITLLFVQIGRV